MLDSATWAALAVVLSAVGAVLTVVAWRRRGPVAGLRGAAWTLVPVALWLTGTLRLAAEIAGDVSRWASRLVFSPTVWAGVVVAGVAALLFVVSGVARARGLGGRRREAEPGAGGRRPPAGARPEVRGREEQDPELAEIEAILKRRGIG